MTPLYLGWTLLINRSNWNLPHLRQKGSAQHTGASYGMGNEINSGKAQQIEDVSQNDWQWSLMTTRMKCQFNRLYLA